MTKATIAVSLFCGYLLGSNSFTKETELSEPTFQEPVVSQDINSLSYDQKVQNPTWQKACLISGSDYFAAYAQYIADKTNKKIFGNINHTYFQQYRKASINFRSLAEKKGRVFSQDPDWLTLQTSKMSGAQGCAEFVHRALLDPRNGLF